MRTEQNCFYWRCQEQEQEQTYRLPSSSAILPPSHHYRGSQHHVCVLQDNGKAYTSLQPKARQRPQDVRQCCHPSLGDCELSLALPEPGQDILLSFPAGVSFA